MNWQITVIDICVCVVFAAYAAKLVIQIVRSAFIDEDKQQRVLGAAEKLAKAGEQVGVGELPSSLLHELYDAVRDYQK